MAILNVSNTNNSSILTTDQLREEFTKKNEEHKTDVCESVYQRYNELLEDNGLQSDKIQDQNGEILYPSVFAEAYKKILDPLEKQHSQEDRIYTLALSYIKIPTTGTFFSSLYQKNLTYQSKVRGEVNKLYNRKLIEFLKPLQLDVRKSDWSTVTIFRGFNKHLRLIPGRNLERLDLDRTTKIFYPKIYAEAYESVLKERGDSLEDSIYRFIQSFAKTDLYTKAYFYELHEKGIFGLVNKEYIRRIQDQNYTFLQRGQCSICFEALCEADLKIIYPDLYDQALRKVTLVNERSKIDDQIIRLAQQHIDQRAYNLDSKSPNGTRTIVYLPTDLPQIILRKPKKESCSIKKTFGFKRDQAQAICDAHGYRHLTIPLSVPYNDFYIEERLPIIQNLMGQIFFYIEHKNELNNAIEELIEFIYEYGLDDLIQQDDWFFSKYYSASNLPRYDNIPFYYDPNLNKYCIGLVDLDHFTSDKSDYKDRDMYFFALEMIRIFPLHRRTILKFARKHDRTIDDPSIGHIPNIETVFAEVEPFFKHLLKYKKFLEKNKISFDNPKQTIPLTEKRIKDITQKIYQELQENYQWNQLTFSEEHFEDFKLHFGEIIQEIYEIICNRVKDVSSFFERIFIEEDIYHPFKDIDLHQKLHEKCEKLLLFTHQNTFRVDFFFIRSIIESVLEAMVGEEIYQIGKKGAIYA